MKPQVRKGKKQSIIRETATRFGVTEERCRREMQIFLDEAWATSRRDPTVKAMWDLYFPDGEKPSLEKFIERLALGIKVV